MKFIKDIVEFITTGMQPEEISEEFTDWLRSYRDRKEKYLANHEHCNCGNS